MAFKEVFEQIGDKIQDLTSLEVMTIEGDVSIDASDAVSSLEEVLAKVSAKVVTNAKVLAMTRLALDGDVIAYVDKGITAEQRQAHADLVDAAAETRTATVMMFKQIAGL